MGSLLVFGCWLHKHWFVCLFLFFLFFWFFGVFPLNWDRLGSHKIDQKIAQNLNFEEDFARNHCKTQCVCIIFCMKTISQEHPFWKSSGWPVILSCPAPWAFLGRKVWARSCWAIRSGHWAASLQSFGQARACKGIVEHVAPSNWPFSVVFVRMLERTSSNQTARAHAWRAFFWDGRMFFEFALGMWITSKILRPLQMCKMIHWFMHNYSRRTWV